MTTYPHMNPMPPHMLHYGVCPDETFQLTEIQDANTAIENTLYRRRSATWPRAMLENAECLEGQNGMQDDVMINKMEVKMETEGYLIESPLPECIISPERSPSIDSSDLSQNVQVSSTQCSSHKTKNKNVWGDMSYAELITKAILSSQNQRMTLAEIYAWIVENVSYFADKKDTSSTSGWKNSIRHNLSLHNKFKRVPNDTSGKSSWWTINPDKSGTKTRRVTSMSPSPRPGTPKLGRKDSGKETPTMKRKERKKGRCRRGSEGTINLTNSPLLGLTRTNSSDACSGDSQASTPMTSPVMKQRSGSFSSMMSSHSPRLSTTLATTTTWNTDVQILYAPPVSPKSRMRSHSHPSHPAESTLIHTISPTVRKSSESRPNCAHSGGTPSPESISDTSQGSGTPQGSWTSPITSPPPSTTPLPAKFQFKNQRVRSSSLTINRAPGLVGITEATKPSIYHPQIASGEYAFSFTTAPPLQHYEAMQPNYQTAQQELNNPYLPPAYNDVQYKRIGVLHTVSDPYGVSPQSNAIDHTQPLSAGAPSQYVVRPREFSFDYEEFEHKILDTQHPRVLDIKRESVGEMPSNSSTSCFQVNMHQNQVFCSQERNYQHNQFSSSLIVDEKPARLINTSCQHAKDTILPHQIDLKNLQPTLISDHVSLHSLDRDEHFEMLDQPWRFQLQSALQ